jgi:hypothetical protein
MNFAIRCIVMIFILLGSVMMITSGAMDQISPDSQEDPRSRSSIQLKEYDAHTPIIAAIDTISLFTKKKNAHDIFMICDSTIPAMKDNLASFLVQENLQIHTNAGKQIAIFPELSSEEQEKLGHFMNESYQVTDDFFLERGSLFEVSPIEEINDGFQESMNQVTVIWNFREGSF